MTHTSSKRIAIQGVKGSFHDMAAHTYFPNDPIDLICCATFEDVFAAVKADSNTLALVAIENTIAGTILHNYELLSDSGLTIVGEQKLRIAHSLLSLPEDSLDDIVEVNSHPMALMQCRDFLARHPQMKVVEAEDTAGAAELIRQNNLRGHAAICSKFAAPLYQMRVLAENIETNKHNFTRFLVLSQPQCADALRDVRQATKASLAFILPHAQGTLAQVLSVLAEYQLNLTKIQSLPIVGKEWQYMFYVDVTFDDYTRYQQSINAIHPLTQELKILGEYQDDRPIA